MTPVPSGCPRCGAHTRLGAQWCTLCYADLRPAPVRSRQQDPALVAVPATPDSESVSEPVGAAASAATRGKHARHDATVEDSGSESEPAEPAEPLARGAQANDVLSTDAMLALLAAESKKPLPGLAGRLESTGSRIALMAGGMVLFATFLFVVMAVIGSVI